MPKQRPHTIILTEIDNSGRDSRESEIAVPAGTIRKLVTERVTLWKDAQPRETKVTIIEHLDRDTTMVKESVREITDLLNGPVIKLTHGNNAECPQVVSGEWVRCQGHQA